MAKTHDFKGTFMHSVQTIRLQVEHVLLLFSVVLCTVQNLLTFLGKEGENGSIYSLRARFL